MIPLDVGNEPHIQHAVGLVDDQNLDLLEVDELPPYEVQQSTRGGHDQIDGSLVESVLLLLDLQAAIDGDGIEPAVLAQVLGVLDDLDGQFPRGGQHQGAGGSHRTLAFDRFPQELAEHGNEKRGRLTRAGLGPSGDIVSGVDVDQRLGLDRRTVLEAQVRDGVHDRLGQIQVVEAGFARLFGDLELIEAPGRPLIAPFARTAPRTLAALRRCRAVICSFVIRFCLPTLVLRVADRCFLRYVIVHARH